MDDNLQTHWYLVRTKTGKERWVRDQLASRVPEVFLPMLKAKVPRWGRMVVSIAPLFPCYVFARFDLQSQYFDVKYMAGVRAIVSAGNDPLAVPSPIVTEIRRRGVDDVIEIPDKPIGTGERVVVVDGPFRGFKGLHTGMTTRDREMVLIKILGATRPVEISAGLVAPLSEGAR